MDLSGIGTKCLSQVTELLEYLYCDRKVPGTRVLRTTVHCPNIVAWYYSTLFHIRTTSVARLPDHLPTTNAAHGRMEQS
jgi:hypothetical protein